MKVLSFDVGIKNLAYCVIDSSDYSIQDWGILNISPDELCEHVHKGGGCNKSAKFVIEGCLICSAHRNLKKYRECPVKKKPKSKNQLIGMGKNIMTCLGKHPNFLEVDVVLIENQPALKNPTMKSVQMMVYSYFLMQGVCDDKSCIDTIELISARNKLKAYTGPDIACDIKDKYKKTKYLGIKYCEYMISHNSNISEEFCNMFEDSKKKDDLADSYLQGMYWLTK
jgi:hypothetical protein